MTKLPLSIIILTERNDLAFQQTLASAQIAQEVLIVDNKSNNDWKALKETYSFSIVAAVETITNFAKVRNEAAAYARFPWVFFLDSDEVILESDYEKLNDCINTADVEGWYLPRQDYFLGKALEYGETSNTSFLRLYQKGKGTFKGVVHETCIVHGKTKLAPVVIQHTPHVSISSFLTAVTMYAELVSRTKKPTQLRLLFEMLCYPIGKFFYNFIIKRGFLDGTRGYIHALIMSLHSFFVRVYIYEKNSR